MKLQKIIFVSVCILVVFSGVLAFVLYMTELDEESKQPIIPRAEELKIQRSLIMPNHPFSMSLDLYEKALKKWGNDRATTIYAEIGDVDGDGISDRQEMILGTNPFNYDTDHDDKMDSAEFSNGTDPLIPD